jgi:hypothetical protein
MESEHNVSKPGRFSALKHRIAVGTLAVAGGATILVPYASAAINFTPITELLEAVVDLIPTLMDLVIAIAPLIVTIAIVGFVLAFLDRILEMLKLR